MLKMKKYLFSFFALIIPFFLCAQDIKKVLVIGIDGCRSDALSVANTPNLDDLISNGIFSPDALNDDITISGPGWSAILCGVWSEKHLVVDNSFTEDNYDDFPSFFQRAEEEIEEVHTVSICHWSPINDFIVNAQADFKLNVSSDVEVANQASSYLSVNDPDLMFLHFDEADGVGHSFGFSPDVPTYISKIEEIDSLIGIVIESVENRETYNQEDWLYLLTTDHGGLGFSHGGTSIEEENVFFIASGKNIDPEVIYKDSIISNIEIENCLNDSIELSFDGVNDNVHIPDHPNLNFGADQDFTIECRVRTSTSADVSIIGNKDWDTGLNKGFVFSFKFPSGPEWKINIGDGVNRVDLDNGGEIADGEWHSLSASFDRDGFMRMFQNGVLIDSADISSIGDIDTDMGLFLGTDINSAYDFEGSISEVRVWNKVLEKESIENWYCSRVDDSHPDIDNLFGYWKMNEGGNTTEIIDYSTFNNTGLISDAVWKQADTMLIELNFENTPRVTDILPTALAHLCIPAKENWNLDGTSLIDVCQLTSIQFENNTEFKVKIYPNPASDEITIELNESVNNKQLSFEIYDVKGAILLKDKISSKQNKVPVHSLIRGTYFIKVTMKDQIIDVVKFVIH